MKIIILLFFSFICCTAYSQNSIYDIARKGTLEEIKEIFSQNPDTINSKNNEGYSPLILACYHANNEVASFIVERCKDINGSSDYGTPLMASVVKGNVAMVKLLLEKKADPNISDGNGTTALIYATMFQHEDIVKLLCASEKIVLDQKDNKGFTAIDYANQLKNENIIQIFKSKKS